MLWPAQNFLLYKYKIDTNLCQGAVKFGKFRDLVLELHMPQNNHTQTDRHFPKIMKSYLGHLKTCKTSKAGGLENFYENNIWYFPF